MPSVERTTTSPKAYDLAPAGRSTQLNKIYVGFVKGTDDLQRMGRLKVWIPELSGDPTDESQWFVMNYASPFAGATSMYDNTSGRNYTDTQRSYGFWFVPPSLENEVVCAFVNGDPARGIWLGCLYQQYMNYMVPGLAGTADSKNLPVAEYNKLEENLNTTNPYRPVYTPLSEALKLQGLENDPIRGTSTSTARRNSPVNAAYGILTPGGTQMVFDDGPENKFIRFRTQTGTQILINDTQGMIYLNTRDGANWIELSADGRISVFGAGEISIRSNQNINLRADVDVRIEAGRSIYMKARGEVGARSAAQGSGSGGVTTARTTNTSQIPAIGPNDTSVNIRVPTDAITGTFEQGMSISGIPWDNPTTNAAPSTGNVSVGNANVVQTTATATGASGSGLAGSGQPVVIIGDTIAVGVGPELAQLRQGAVTSAQMGATSTQVASSVANNSGVQNAQWAVCSVGSYDAGGGELQPGVLTDNLGKIRSSLNAQNYTWILPKEPLAHAAVYGFAVGKGDAVQDIGASTDGITPKDYKILAQETNSTQAATTPPNNSTNVISTQGQAPAPQNAQLGSVTTDGNVTILNVSFSPGNTSQASNSSVVVGTLQGDTSNVSVPTTNYNSTDAGMIMINAAKDMHLVADRDMFQMSTGKTARTAKGNLFDYSYGSYDVAIGGYLTMQSNGLMSLGTTNNMVMEGSKVDINGPAASAALTAPAAKTPLDAFLKDNEVYAQGQFRFVVKNTIVSSLPYHEPYDGHGGSTAGTNGYVVTGPAIDGASGEALKTGAVTSGQTKPLDLAGAPNKDSPAGNYLGQSYDKAGKPVYRYDGENNSLNPAGSYSLSTAGIEFLFAKEGKRASVYNDLAGNPTIGWGHKLLPDEVAGNYITLNGSKRQLNAGPLSDAEITALFKQDARPREDEIRKRVKVKITQTQFDMLFALVYNCGIPTDVFTKLNSGSYDCSKEWMSHSYIRVKGTNERKFVQSLYNRRLEEYTNFSKGTPIGTPAAS